jgi:tetratricopeptide (TPR) repeat protein
LPEALSARARVFLAQQQYGDAIDYARKAMDRKLDCEGAWDVLGRALFTADRWKEAADLVDRAIEVCGHDYNVYIAYLNVLSAWGEAKRVSMLRKKLVNTLEHQIDVVPEDVRARMLLANT